jgi:hypothetical protein
VGSRLGRHGECRRRLSGSAAFDHRRERAFDMTAQTIDLEQGVDEQAQRFEVARLSLEEPLIQGPGLLELSLPVMEDCSLQSRGRHRYRLTLSGILRRRGGEIAGATRKNQSNYSHEDDILNGN